MKVPGRIEMGAVMGRERYLFDRPTLAIGQILGLQSFEELQHARQTLLVVDILDRGMIARRIGRYIVLQRHGNIDQSSGHERFLKGCCSILSSHACYNRKCALERDDFSSNRHPTL